MSAIQASIISERAYAIWEQQGRPDGQALDHWLQAETELKDAAQTQASVDQRPIMAAVASKSLKAVVRRASNKRSPKKS
jgi:hypothetical protein